MRKATTRAVMVLLLAVAAGGTAATQEHEDRDSEPKQLDVHVTPQATQSPGTIRVTATMERNPANREIAIEADSGAFFRSSSRSLEGAAAARRYTRVFAGLPAGTYEITATLKRNDGTELVEVVMVEVFGPPRG